MKFLSCNMYIQNHRSLVIKLPLSVACYVKSIHTKIGWVPKGAKKVFGEEGKMHLLENNPLIILHFAPESGHQADILQMFLVVILKIMLDVLK